MRISRKERVGLWMHRTLDKRLSRLGVAAYRRTHGGISDRMNVDVLALTTIGRKSGKRRTVLLQYFSDDEGLLLVAADGGSDRHPAWYHNLLARPNAEAEIRNDLVAVHATELSPAEAEAAWPAILERAPDYERYLRATDRQLPLIRLRRT